MVLVADDGAVLGAYGCSFREHMAVALGSEIYIIICYCALMGET